jgi:hypothetical protein
MNNGAHMYFCGLKGMMPGILDMLEGVCKEKGLNFEEWVRQRCVAALCCCACDEFARVLTRAAPRCAHLQLEGLKHKGQWHVEVRKQARMRAAADLAAADALCLRSAGVLSVSLSTFSVGAGTLLCWRGRGAGGGCVCRGRAARGHTGGVQQAGACAHAALYG